MKKILINGNFLCRNLTGIERFAFETIKQLDLIVSSEDNISILVPSNAKTKPVYKNIRIIESEKPLTSHPLWDLFYMGHIAKKEKAFALNFANTSPLGKRAGFTFLHDIYAKIYPEDFVSKRDKLMRLYNCFSYWNTAKHCKKVLTVSEFSKKQISETYNICPDNIIVVPNGWDHFELIEPDFSIFEKYPDLKNRSFYFTLGSLSKRKNLKWIAEYASRHTDEFFAISGKMISGLVPPELEILTKLPNVTCLGYVSDQEVKALMQKCKAFVLPSYYEGFGIPPLEALSSGAKIIVAKAASLPEIYNDCAHYIDPDNSVCDLGQLLSEPVSSPEKILSKYTYKNAAIILRDFLKTQV